MSFERVEIGDAVLYRGDAREVLGSLSGVDSLITDPPYGIAGGSGGDSRDFSKGAYIATDWDDTEDYIEQVCVEIVQRALAISGRAAITPGIRCMHMYPRARDIGCFWTPASMTHGPWGFTNFQPILYYGKDFRAGKGALPSGRSLTEAAEKNGHPCPKPLQAWKWLVEKASQPGELVLDPFMGSGTTGVCCETMGRRFIGIEIEKKYFDIACERIANAQRQQTLFSPAPVMQQEALL